MKKGRNDRTRHGFWDKVFGKENSFVNRMMKENRERKKDESEKRTNQKFLYFWSNRK